MVVVLVACDGPASGPALGNLCGPAHKCRLSSVGFSDKKSTLCFTLCTIMTLLLLILTNTHYYMNFGVAKCVWQNGKTKSAHGVVKPASTHLGCHVGEDFPCTNLLVGSMTWTWSSWDRHRVYRRQSSQRPLAFLDFVHLRVTQIIVNYKKQITALIS